MNEERRNPIIEEEEEIDLVELFHVLVKNLGNILRIALVFIIGAGIYLCFAKPVYESNSKLRIKIPRGITSSMLEQNGSIASRQLMSTYEEILKSRSVVEEVIQKTQQPNEKGEYPSYESFSKLITTTNVKDTEIMKVSVKANDPVLAQKANDVLLETFIDRLTKLSQEDQKRKRMFLEESLKEIKNESTASKELVNTLTKRVEEARIAETAVAMEVQIVDKADLPKNKVAPKRTMIMGIAALAGALLGAGLVVLRSLFNRTIKSGDDIEKMLGIPCLGQVPDFHNLQKNMAKEGKTGILGKLKGVLWK